MAEHEDADDDSWLYGDKIEESDKEKEGPTGEPPVPGLDKSSLLSAEAQPFQPKVANGGDKEAGELSGDEDAKKENEAVVEPAPETEVVAADEDDDDSDDDVQVTIGDIKAAPTYEQRSLFKGAAYQKSGATTAPAKGVDLEAEGEINGQPVYEFDIESVDDKPWRKPGADITDYFNYGFTEETWIKYCRKQHVLGLENQPHKSFVHHSNVNIKKEPGTGPNQTVHPVTTGEVHSYRDHRPTALPTYRKLSGTIDVIGSTTLDSRRPPNEYIDPEYGRKFQVTSIVSGVPGPHIPPPDFAVPPPGMPPPNMHPPGMPPPAYYPPPGLPPPDRGPPPGYGYDGYPPFSGPPPNVAPPPWHPQQNRPVTQYPGVEYYRREDSDISSSDDEDRRRTYDRDYYKRDLVSRDRSRSRSRERRPRDRDRGDRSRRRRHRDDTGDSDSHRSRHKKSKRSREESEEAPVEPPAVEAK